MPAPDSTDPDRSGADPDPGEDVLVDADLVIVGRMPWSSNATFLVELWPPGSRPDAGLEPDEATPAGRVAARTRTGPGPGDDTCGDGAADAPRAARSDQHGGDAPGHGAGPGPAGTGDPGNHEDHEDHEEVAAGPLGRAVYKPHRGERPLWDFPDGLYRREVAAFRLARALGWDAVPTTVERHGPFGVGSVQRFVEADFEQHYFTMLEDPATHPQLRRMAAFDIVANSTDRKGGHVLVDDAGHLWGIDNGLCLHAEFKLRTVIWDFAGESLPADLADDLVRFLDSPLPDDLADLLDAFERDALRTRVRALLAEARFPRDRTGRRVPWPLV